MAGRTPPGSLTVTRQIPIKNLYYLFLYAWNCFPQADPVEIEADEGLELFDLFAKVLAASTRQLLRRGIDRGYQLESEIGSRPRGRLLLSQTVGSGAVARGAAAYCFDELTNDIPANRVLKAVLQALGRSTQVRPALAHDCLSLARQLREVTDCKLSSSLFRLVQIGRNNRHYDLVLKIAELLLQSLLPGEGDRRGRFADIVEDEVRMSSVFESFLRNFYRMEQSHFGVEAEHIRWNAKATNPDHLRLLPTMRTDLTLRSPTRNIVVDAKFYQRTLISHMGGTDKVRSDHLYQLLAYMRHITADGLARPEGLLLYPKTSVELRLQFQMEGSTLRVCTVDMQRSWREIRSELLHVIADH